MMKKAAFLLIPLALILLSFPVFALSIQPNSWAEAVNAGQTITRTFTLNTAVNETQNLNFNKEGQLANWTSIDKNSVTLNASSDTLTATISVPTDTITGTYTGSVNYSGTSLGSIPVTLFVQSVTPILTSDCGLIPIPTNWRKSIKQGALTSKAIIVQVSQKCVGAVTFKNLDLVGGIVTGDDNLDRPFRIEEENLGQVLPGNELTVPIVIDTVNVETGTYDTILEVIALTQNGTLLKTAVSMSLLVARGISPVSNTTFSSPPTCSLPSTNLQANMTYALTCSNRDPNIGINVLFNDFLKGLKVEEPANQYVWNFLPVKEGETTLTVYFTHKGAPIGEAASFNLKISQNPIIPLGNILRLRLFPPESEITVGQTVAVLAEDDLTSIVLSEVDFFLNGQKMSTNTFTPEQGQTYTLMAAKNGFLSAEKTITLHKSLIIINTEGYVEEGSLFNINANPVNATVKINGEAVQNPLNLTAGTYSLTAEYPGFETYQSNLSVDTPFTFTSEIPKMQLGQSYKISFSKPIEWVVLFQEKNGTVSAVIAASTSQLLEFLPEGKGIYTIQVRGQTVKAYDKTGLSLGTPFKIVAGIIGGLVVLYFLRKFLAKSPAEEEGETSGAYEYTPEE